MDARGLRRRRGSRRVVDPRSASRRIQPRLDAPCRLRAMRRRTRAQVAHRAVARTCQRTLRAIRQEASLSLVATLVWRCMRRRAGSPSRHPQPSRSLSLPRPAPARTRCQGTGRGVGVRCRAAVASQDVSNSRMHMAQFGRRPDAPAWPKRRLRVQGSGQAVGPCRRVHMGTPPLRLAGLARHCPACAEHGVCASL